MIDKKVTYIEEGFKYSCKIISQPYTNNRIGCIVLEVRDTGKILVNVPLSKIEEFS